MGGLASSSDAFRAVADATRRAMLDLLRDRERSAGELGRPFAMSKPAVSQHLRVLQDAGLVRARQSGRQRLYRLTARPLRDVCRWAGRYQEIVDPAGHVWRIGRHGAEGRSAKKPQGQSATGPEGQTARNDSRSEEAAMKPSPWLGGMLVALAASAPAAARQTTQRQQDHAALSAPGQEHQRLEALVGEWRLDAEFRLSPNAAWEKTTGRAQYRRVLDGRFVAEEASVNLRGRQFEWMGFYGFDNRQGKYTAVWIDNGDTGIEHADGAFDEARKAVVLRGEQPGPGGGSQAYKWVVSLASPDGMGIEMVTINTDGSEFTNMRITGTRMPASSPGEFRRTGDSLEN